MITAGKQLLKLHLPASYHKLLDSLILDAKGINQLFSKIQQDNPELYSRVQSDLTRLGFEIATRHGSSLSLDDLISPIDKDKQFKKLQPFINKVQNNKSFTQQQKTDKIFDIYDNFLKGVDKQLLDQGLKDKKSLQQIIRQGSRGSPAQYRATIATQGIMQDNKGQPLIDFPVKSSFQEGLTLPEYLVGTFGARQGEVSKKLCQNVDDLIFTNLHQIKRIGDIKPGDTVIGSDLKGNLTPVKVLNYFNNGIMPVYRYMFREGNTQSYVHIDQTEDHRIVGFVRDWNNGASCTGNKEMKLKDFKVTSGKNRSFKAQVSSIGGNFGTINEPRALFLGLMLGDGCWAPSTRGKPCFSCADPLLLQDIKEYLQETCYFEIRNQENSPYCQLNQTETFPKEPWKDSNGNTHSTGHPTIKWLYDLNLIGTYSHTKFLPEQVYNWDNESIQNLLQGIYSTDGSIGKVSKRGNISITLQLTSKDVVEKVKTLLFLRFGIHTGPVLTTPKEKIKGSLNDLYTIIVSTRQSIRRFNEVIPLKGIKKTELQVQLEKVHNLPEKEHSRTYIGKKYLGMLPVCDIEVDHPDHFFVLQNGIISHNSVQDQGYLSKQLSRQNFTTKVEMRDCGTTRGLPFSTADKESIGQYLQQPQGRFNHNDEITQSMLQELRSKKVEEIVVRSPQTCQQSQKGHFGQVCQLCVGKREKGLQQQGDYIGLLSQTALGEPLQNQSMKARHSGGAQAKQHLLGGFKTINQLFNIPSQFQHRAPIAEEQGTVTKIEEQSGGGKFVYVNNDQYHVPVGFETKVKKNQKVEQGDVLSEGLINPQDIVRIKGIGEGRRYFINTMKDTYDNTGIGVQRRNFEVVSKQIIDHVKVEDPDGIGNHLPDSIVSYSQIEKDYKPRASSKSVSLDKQLNKYLEEPVLHLTIGTKLNSTMLQELKRHNVDKVLVNDQEPAFSPVMLRLLDVPGQVPDWQHQLYSTYLSRRLSQQVNEGMSSSIKGPSPVMGLQYSKGFGKKQEVEDVEEDLLLKEQTLQHLQELMWYGLPLDQTDISVEY